MAEAVVAQLVAVVSRSVLSKLEEEWRLKDSLKKDVEYLKKELRSMNAALREVAEVPPDQIDELVELWANDTRELSCDIESVIDTFHKVEGSEPAANTDGFKLLTKKVPDLFRKGKARHQIDAMIDDIKYQLQDLSARRDRYLVDCVVTSPAATTTVVTHLCVQESKSDRDVDLALEALGSLLPKLVELLNEDYNLRKGVKKGVESLVMELTSMRSALREVAEMPQDQLDEQAKLRAKELGELSHRIEDIFNPLLVRAEGFKLIANPDGFKGLTKKMANFVRKNKNSNQIAAAMGDIEFQLRDVSARHSRYRVHGVVANLAHRTTIEPRMYVDHATGAMGSVVPKLGELLKEEYKLRKGVKKDVKSVSKELRTMDAALRKVVAVPDQQLDHWANNVRGMSYRIEDIVDTLLARVEGFETASNPDGFRGFLKIMSPINLMNLRYQIFDKIEAINCQVQDVATQRDRYGFYGVNNRAATTTIDPHRSALYKDVKETELVGIDGAKDELIKRLTQRDDVSKQQTKTISIVGSAGVGKTTLAYLVSREVKSQFHCVAFVSVSPMPDIEGIFKEMLRQLEVESYAYIHKEPKDEIRDFLQNKRYLIVIDDLWNAEDWDNILCSLPTNDCGSRVITTTRINDIAKKCCSGHGELIYEIKPLGYQNSKRLFLKQFFGSGVSCPDEPSELLDEILKMCSGMPSAIISIASLLASKVTTTDQPWQEVKNSLYSAWKKMMDSLQSASRDIPGLEDLIAILSLSYIHSPNHLKNCLLCLVTTASAKKKQRFVREKLVRKWIAEGFISKHDSCNLEEVANGYFDELISRNVIQPVEHGNYCLGEETYEVNYMMLYVLRLISQEEQFATFLSDLDTSQTHVMHVRLFIECSDAEGSIGTERMDLSNVRSITMFGPAKSVRFKNLLYLRVLDLDGCEYLDDADVIDMCRMVLLKYLSLKQTQVTEVPRQIGNLRYLETLDVRQTRVKELPKELVQLPRLANLLFGQTSSIGGVKVPAGSNQLKSVKVLGAVDTRECSASVMEEITELTELTEFAVVLYDGPAEKKRNDILLSSIGKFGNLQSLIIYGDSGPSDELLPASESPNFPRLDKLKVAGRFVKVPGWIAQLSVLKKLDIRVCKLEPDHLGILGGLTRLSSLALALVTLPKKQVAVTGSTAGFARLEVFSFDCRVPWITFEHSAMPSLRHLHLKLYLGCAAGKTPSGIMNLHSLEKIILRYSSHYASSGGVTKTVAAMRDEADRHGNRIELSVNGDHEIFPSNTRDDKRITGTEIEECY